VLVEADAGVRLGVPVRQVGLAGVLHLELKTRGVGAVDDAGAPAAEGAVLAGPARAVAVLCRSAVVLVGRVEAENPANEGLERGGTGGDDADVELEAVLVTLLVECQAVSSGVGKSCYLQTPKLDALPKGWVSLLAVLELEHGLDDTHCDGPEGKRELVAFSLFRFTMAPKVQLTDNRD